MTWILVLTLLLVPGDERIFSPDGSPRIYTSLAACEAELKAAEVDLRAQGAPPFSLTCKHPS